MSLHGRHSAKDTAQFSPPAATAARPDEDEPSGERPPGERPSGEKSPRQKEESGLGFLRELPILILIAFVIAIVIKTFVVQAFYIPSPSMEPTPADRNRRNHFVCSPAIRSSSALARSTRRASSSASPTTSSSS